MLGNAENVTNALAYCGEELNNFFLTWPTGRDSVDEERQNRVSEIRFPSGRREKPERGGPGYFPGIRALKVPAFSRKEKRAGVNLMKLFTTVSYDFS
jgi:hypothetical protein